MKITQGLINLTTIFSIITCGLIGVVFTQHKKLKLLELEIAVHEKSIASLLEKIEQLKALLLEVSERAVPIAVITPVETSATTIVVFTVIAMFGIFFFYYFTNTTAIFAPVRTMSYFDDVGNQIMLGVRYPVESPVSASIRLAGSPDSIPIFKFVQTIKENTSLSNVVGNEVAPIVVNSAVPLFETCKIFLLSIIHIFI